MPEVSVFSPPNLPYPVTVSRLFIKANEAITTSSNLFEYCYKTKVIEDDVDGQQHEVEKSNYVKYQSTVAGTLAAWAVSTGDVINEPDLPLATIEVNCIHATTFDNICADCGEVVDEVNYNTRPADAQLANTSISLTHPALKISAQEAQRLDQEAKQRMLAARKLSLVVDLDLTIIHASVDPTIGEWQSDPSNPNYDAVKSVRVFELYDEALQKDVAYYIKLRPYLEQFLETISQIYELYIYTMGTRAYADNIAKIVDPDKRLFGDRILSRTETPGEDSKSLRKLFPIDNRMVVIIDDRADVWKWSNYLVRVQPFNFFVGIGDINSSFLPKQEIIAKEQVTEAPTDDQTKTNIDGDQSSVYRDPTNGEESRLESDESALQQIVNMQENNADESMEQKTAEQDEKLAEQINERPLLQLQQSLEHEHLSDAQNLLKDDDNELLRIRDILVNVHKQFFGELDQRHATADTANGTSEVQDPYNVPDVKDIIDELVDKPLKGCKIAFSGVIPSYSHKYEVLRTRWADIASKLGAKVRVNLVKKAREVRVAIKRPGREKRSIDMITKPRRTVTHLVAKPDGVTDKMRQAAAEGIPIVRDEWLWDQSLHWWEAIDVFPYKIHVDPKDASSKQAKELPDDASTDEEAAQGASDDSEEEDEDKQDLMLGEYGWDCLDDMPELDDEDDDDDDSEFSASQKSTASAQGQKRKRAIDEDSTDGQQTTNGTEFRRPKRKAQAGPSNLSKVQIADEDISGGEEDEEEEQLEGDGDEDDDEELALFRAAMEEELSRAAEDEDGPNDDDGG